MNCPKCNSTKIFKLKYPYKKIRPWQRYEVNPEINIKIPQYECLDCNCKFDINIKG